MSGGHANFLQALGWAVLNSLWQIALLWLIYLGITSVYRKANAAAKSWLATLLLFSGFLWFVFTLLTSWMGGPGQSPVINAAVIGASGNDSINNGLKQFLPFASVAYLILLVVPAFRYIRNYRYVSVIRQFGLSKIHVDWRLFVKQVAVQLGITKPVGVWISEFVSSPVTIGFFKPIILVPLAAVNQLTTQQLEAVLLHELSHIRRCDYLVNLLINAVRVILYYNPFVTAFVKTIEREREKSCDEIVLQYRYNSYDYAAALLALEKESHSRILALAAAGNRNDLLNRVETILGIKSKRKFSLQKLMGLVTGILLLVGFNALVAVKPAAKKDNTGAYAHMSAPFSPISGSYSPVVERPGVIERTVLAATEQAAEKKAEMTATDAGELAVINSLPAIQDGDLLNVNFSYNYQAAPLLTDEQEQQVKEAIAASRRVLENEQWKVIEDNIGEVFTEKEKAALKSKYHKEVSKFDWKKWENNLKMSYGKVDWENVNYQLDNALKQITLDSLHKVYNEAFVELSKVRKELAEEGLRGIPDTDITLKEIDSARREAQKVLRDLKTTRRKKIAHL